MVITYESTRGDAPKLDFGQVLLTGLASDGGLYCPSELPTLPDVTAETSYQDAAVSILTPFTEPTFDRQALTGIVQDAYATFRHADVCPIVDLGGGQHLLDLANGPTLAFKDVALQLVGRMLAAELERTGRHLTILAATSGDTGSAAIDALADRANIEVVILHPLDRVSEIQRRQMTTVTAANVNNIAIRGTFDDCQDLVKAAFGDERMRHDVSLGAVNSINWARVLAQTVYYVTAARAVRPNGEPVTFVVPTGNFGNILAGWYAKRMGLAVNRLVVASNRNDVLTRFFETGRLETETVVPSLSPSMDIQISSNFERLLWEVSGRDSEAIVEVIGRLRTDGQVALPVSWHEEILREFDFSRVNDDQTMSQIAATYQANNILIDPHTAVGVGAAQLVDSSDGPVIVLATAAPAKFGATVAAATGTVPRLPKHLRDLEERPESFEVMEPELPAIAAKLRSLGS